MSTPTKLRRIRALIGLTKLPDERVTSVLNDSLKGLTTNATLFSKPPIDFTTYQAAIDAYKDAQPAANDGSRTAISQKNKLRDVAIRMYVHLAHHVEAACNDDMTTFLLSGFQPVTTTKRRHSRYQRRSLFLQFPALRPVK